MNNGPLLCGFNVPIKGLNNKNGYLLYISYDVTLIKHII